MGSGPGELLGCFFNPRYVLYRNGRYGIYSLCGPLRAHHGYWIGMGKFVPVFKHLGETRYIDLWLLRSGICGYRVIYPAAVSDRDRYRYRGLRDIPSCS